MSGESEFHEHVLTRARHLYPTQEVWNQELWREHYITDRIRRLIQAGFWPPPAGWAMDLLAPGVGWPKRDFVESLRLPPKPRLVCVDGRAV
jgi:hypothetical protein